MEEFGKFVTLLALGFVIGLLVSLALPTNYELPEEINLISNDTQHPDTLIGWKDNKGVIHIGFKH